MVLASFGAGYSSLKSWLRLWANKKHKILGLCNHACKCLSPPKEMEEDAPTNSVAHGGVDLAPHARKAFKPINVTDRRSKKRTVLLKRFRDYIHQQNG